LPSSVSSAAPVTASQSRTVLSRDPHTMRLQPEAPTQRY
jgi:hypothetical protein